MEQTGQWAIKYRPTKFEDVVGCSTVKAMVESNAKTDKWPKSVMLMGQFGGGKTTCARLIAMSMTCQHKDEKGNPCCQCPDCKAILDEKYTRDVKRFCAEDLRTEGGYTEGMAKLVQQAKSQPFFGKKKIIIFEEVQTVLNAGNAKSAVDLLLRELENPNSKTYWIFTAMDDISVPMKGGRKAGAGGFMSRQIVHKFNPVNDVDILKYLYNLAHRIEYNKGEYTGTLWEYLTKNAGKEFCTNGLLEIAKGADGSLRTATQMLQNCVDSETFRIEDIRYQFGLLDDAVINEVLNDIVANIKSDKAFDLLGRIDGTNYTRLYYSWSRALKEAAMAKIFDKVCYTDKNKETGKLEYHVVSSKSEDFFEKRCYDTSVALANGPNYQKLVNIFETFSDAEKGFNADLFVLRLLNCYK